MSASSNTPACHKNAPLPAVSVIIPAYNYAEYLPFAIDSVLAQAYPEYELIVVDDGSTDSTPAALEQYKGKINAIRQENKGLPAARNTGIQAARFPFLAFLDADDAWRPGLLAKLAQTMQALPPETGILACLARTIGPQGETIKSLPHTEQPAPCREILWQDILLKTRFGSSGLLVAKNCFEKCGLFDTSLKSSEDRDMWLRIAAHFKVFLVPEDLALIRRHSRNMSANSWRMKNNMLRVIKTAMARPDSPPVSLRLKLKVLSYFHYETALMHHDSLQYFHALKGMLASFALHPFPFNTDEVGQARFFRLRAMARFLINTVLRAK